MVKNKFVAIEGVDGCGKTTLVNQLKDKSALLGLDYTVNSPKTINEVHFHAARSLELLKQLIWPHEDWKEYAHIMPRDYWMYLQAAWYSVQSEHYYRPYLEDGNKILSDGWIYKFMAKLIIDGFDRDYVWSVFSNVIKPDMVILLDISPTFLFDRRENFSAYEKGSMIGATTKNGSSYIRYQEMIRAELLHFSRSLNWEVLSIEKYESPQDIAEKVIHLL